MDQDFKFNFDEMLDGPQPESSGTAKGIYNFASPGHVRNLCFVWPDGRKKFLNYAYLVSGDYEPEKNTITLIYTSDTVTLTGIRLEALFTTLLSHLPKLIVCTNIRYNALVGNELYIVNNIEVIKN